MVHHTYAIFSAHYLPSMGGVELFTRSLASQLAAEGNDVTVVTSVVPGEPETSEGDGFDVVRLPARRLMGGRLPVPQRNRAYRRMWQELLGRPFDRVVVNTRFYGHSLEGLRLAEAVGVPAVLIEHGSAHLTLGNPAADRVIATYEHRVTAKVEAYDPIFAGVSLGACRWLAHFGIETDLVVNNAIDAEAFRAQRSTRDFRRELELGPGRSMAAYMARLVAGKGAAETLEAARLLPDVAFVVAGSGPDEDKVRAEAADMANVAVVGRLDRGDVSALLAQSDFFVFPSSYPEGLPTSLLEAGAWGCLPVVTDVGGVEDVLYGAGAGRVCRADGASVAEALGTLADLDPRERSAQSRALRQRIDTRFSWSHTVAQLDDAFASRGF